MNRKSISLLVLTLLLTVSLSAAGVNSWSNDIRYESSTNVLVRIQTEDFNIPIDGDVEIVGYLLGGYVEVIMPRVLLAELDDIDYSVLIWDVDAHNQAVKGSYHTLSEMENMLLSISNNYPNITDLYSIGKSYEGRDIWCLEITDNPGVDEGEPGVFFMGLHHAREWPTVEICLNIADELTSEYGSDINITDIVDNRRLWLVTCVNPDGYYYDHDLGHDWRKNRHYFPEFGTYGVDLNRNYGGSCNGDPWGSWGAVVASNIDHHPSSSTYCGPSPISENETQIIRDIFLQNDICASISWHTHGELVLWPWSYSTSLTTPDNTYLSYVGTEIASRITRQSGSGTYTPQQGSSLYPTSGDTTEWAYGYGHYVQGRPTFAYTIEACSSFHPSESTLDQICLENLEGALYFLEEAQNISNVVPRVIPPEIDDMNVDSDGDYTVSWQQQNPQANPDYFQLDELANLSAVTDDAESGSTLWNLDGFSITTSRYHSAASSYKSLPASSEVSSMTSVFPLPVESGMNLSFWCWYDIEYNYDEAMVEVSRNGRLYDVLDNFTGSSGDWIYKSYDLSDYVDESIFIRFRYTTDSNTLEEGLFVDDINQIADFGSINNISSSITDSHYDIMGKTNGSYYYRIKGYNTEHGWGDFSTLEKIQVGQISDTTHISDLLDNWNFVSLLFNQSVGKPDLIVNYEGTNYNWSNAVSNGYISDYIFGWNRVSQGYEFVDTFEPGYGYWIYSYENCELLAPETSMNFDGYITDIKANWNIFGLPNDQSANKTDIIVNYDDTDYNWSDAVSNGYINDYIFGWNRVSQGYEFADTLTPGYSYWMFAYQPCNLKGST